jgi:preprotein translocase subunit SecD
MIKGFGLMLAIWIILSLFTVMWISKVFLLFISEVMKDKKKFVWYKE